MTLAGVSRALLALAVLGLAECAWVIGVSHDVVEEGADAASDAASDAADAVKR